MSDINYGRMAQYLIANLSLPEAKIIIDRKKFTVPEDFLHALLVFPTTKAYFKLEDSLDEQAFPRIVVVDKFDTRPFITRNKAAQATALADRYDTLLKPVDVEVTLQELDDLTQMLTQEAPSNPSMLRASTVYLSVRARQYNTVTEWIGLERLFASSVVADAWAAGTNSEPGSNFLGDFNYF